MLHTRLGRQVSQPSAKPGVASTGHSAEQRADGSAPATDAARVHPATHIGDCLMFVRYDLAGGEPELAGNTVHTERPLSDEGRRSAALSGIGPPLWRAPERYQRKERTIA